MALIPQKVPVLFRGLDSKQDPRSLIPGDLTLLENVRFDAPPKIQKRFGYAPLATLSAGSLLAPFKGQLLMGDGREAYSYAASGSVDKGVLETLSVSALPVCRNAYAQSSPDGNVHPAGISVYAWETAAGGVQYSVFDSATSQPIVTNVLISATASRPKVLALGGYVVVLYFDSATNHLRYLAIPAASPASPQAAADLALDPSTSPVVYDATVVGGTQLFCAYLTNAGKIAVTYLTSGLVLGAETQTVTAAATTLGIFPDPSQNVWLVYSTSGAVYAVAYTFDLSTQVFAPATVDAAPGTVRNVTGIVPGASATVLYEVAGSASYNNLIKAATVTPGAPAPVLLSASPVASGGSFTAGTYYYRVSALGTAGETLASNEASATVVANGSVNLAWTAVAGATGYRVYRGTSAEGESVYQLPGNVTSFTDAGAAGTAGTPLSASTFVAVSGVSVLLRSVGLASKPFYKKSRVHFLAAYQSALQSTYFLVSGSTVVGKLAPSVGGGLTARSILPEVANPSTGVYSVPYLQTDQIGAQAGAIFSQAGVMAGTFDFTNPQNGVELSDDLHLSGGIVSMYDGAQVCEHGFHLYPENLTFTAGGAGSISGQYQAVAVYEWMDAQGLIHQSSPSPVQTVTASSAAYFNYSVQSLRLTSKQTPVSVVFYRTNANATVFYRVTSISSPVLNSTTADTVSAPTNGDTLSDAQLAGNAQLIFNPDNASAEIAPLSAPAALHLWRYRNRLCAIPAENAYQWIYSKAFVPGTPIEFNAQQLFQPVSQDGGPLSCGIEMDEKNILFSASRIYFVAGDGPAANGTGGDYGSAPQQIPSDVGCSNRRSLVLTPAGVMFQAANGKGIYLLGRDLSVSYIGAAVEAFNGATVTAARLAPNSRRVIFTLDSGIALAFDYAVGKWSVWTNHAASDLAPFQGKLTYVQPGGLVLQETPGQFLDNGNPILIGLSTSWLSFAGLSGFQRVWRMAIRGDYRSPHRLLVSVAYDDDPAPIQFETLDAGALYGQALADTTTADTDDPGGGAYPPYELLVKLARQKCASVQITIREAQTGSAYGEGFALSGLTFLVGTTGRGLHPVAAGRVI